MAKDTAQYQRAADYVEGIGDNLDLLQGRDVLLHSFEASKRPMKGEQKDFVELTISELDTPDTITSYHAWSQSLAEKLTQMDKNPDIRYPVLVKFVRVPTSAGFRVWSFE